jgi:ribonuclease P protein component
MVLAGRRFKSYLLIGGESRRKAGFIAGRTVGGAVERNRARRLLREAYRQLQPHTAPLGFKIVFVAGPGIAGAAARDVHSDMKSVFRSYDLLTDERRGE